ncbi:MAG TPA: hypothetical protein VHV49_19530 [Pseudonocardiaceae bacterium]|nr:hypothetical protein [Pseudonocardiaceae bacterium]
MTKRTKITLVAGTAALALAGIGGGVAFASGDTPAAAPAALTAAAPTTPPAHHVRRWVNRVEHGEFTVRTKQGDRVVDVQRGQVTSVSSTSVTVRSGDGFTRSYTVPPTARIRSRQKASSITAVHDGDRVVVLATRAGGKDTLRRMNDTRH